MKKLFISTILAIFALPVFAQYSQTANGVKATVNGVDVEVQFFSSKIVRVLKSPAGTEFEKNSLSVIKTPEKVDFTVAKAGDAVVAKTADVAVSLNAKTGRVTFNDPSGKLLLNEKEYGIQFMPMSYTSREFANDALAAGAYGYSPAMQSQGAPGMAAPGQPAPGQGAPQQRRRMIQVTENTYEISQGFLFEEGEAIYGLGQQQAGYMNQRNQRLDLDQNNMLVAIPYLASTKGYGLFWDNYSRTLFTDTQSSGTTFVSDAGDCADYYFLYGGDGDGTVALMRDLTGDAPMMPLWSFGYWQSKERYESQDELVGIVKQYRDLQVPLDAVIQDWKYWDVPPQDPGKDLQWNAIQFHNPAYPDPTRMMKEIHDLHAHSIISVWSQFGTGTEVYKQLAEINANLPVNTWPGSSHPYDVFNPEANAIVWNRMRDSMFVHGIDGWWLDGTEPEIHDPKTVAQYNFKTALGPFRNYRNAFPLYANRNVYNGQRATTSDKRVYLLTRSAFAGQQRYAANTWSGDITASYDIFHKQISAGLNFSICGIPYWNTDIGAFYPPRDMPAEYTGHPANYEFYKQLYVRWFQFSTFHPMLRSHGTRGEYEIWRFGERGTWAFDAIEKYIHLRYKLLPYIYSTAWQVTNNRYSFLRHPYMDSPQDKNTYEIDDEFLFGRSFLVAPIIVENAVSREVYLPSSSAWFDFWTDEKFEGGQTVTKDAPIDIEPIYVKSGSIVPYTTQKVQYAEQIPWTKLELKVYPGADASFVLYEDEKDNYNYESGAYTEIPMTWNEAAQTLTIGARKGSFNGMIKSRKFVVNVAGGKSKTVSYSGKEIAVKF